MCIVVYLIDRKQIQYTDVMQVAQTTPETVSRGVISAAWTLVVLMVCDRTSLSRLSVSGV